MSPLASTLPANDGYVAAAYIVFFVLLLVYLTIMGIRLSRMERRLRELQERREPGANRGEPVSDDEAEAVATAAGATTADPREREIV
jgi:CcmD family protein